MAALPSSMTSPALPNQSVHPSVPAYAGPEAARFPGCLSRPSVRPFQNENDVGHGTVADDRGAREMTAGVFRIKSSDVRATFAAPLNFEENHDLT